MKVVGVNGFGRIGRYFTRLAIQDPEVEVALVNDLAGIETLAHLLKYDSVHRGFGINFKIVGDVIHFANGKQISFLSEKNPESIPWDTFGVQTVIESTGLFRNREKASRHLSGGAKKVIISAPADDDDVRSVVIGVNEHLIMPDDQIISNASCTTNSAAPMMKVMTEMCRIENAFITTVHSYTSDQRLHDAPHSDLRRARAAAESIVPTSTGAAKAIARIFPELEGKIGGCGVRVPVPNGSITDLTMIVTNPPSETEIREAMKKASQNELKGILAYTEDPIVSVDIIGNPHSCIFDAELTSVVGNMVKLMGWYDNEAGYSNRLLDLVKLI